MKKRTSKLLSLLLTLAMVLGMLPAMSITAFAEGTREEVDTIKATAIIKAIPHRKKEPNTAKCDIINL